MKNLLMISILAFFWVTGCAHGPAVISSAEVSDLSIQPNQQTSSAEINSASARLSDRGAASQSNKAAAGDEALEEENPGYIADPIEPWNRAMFQFNDKFYFWLLKPVAKGYRTIIPSMARTGIENFFTNLAMPVRFVGCMFQGKITGAANELSRFLLNTTVGVLGFGNPAKNYPELNPPKEDLGQALGSYGVGNGFYIVWPIIGPSSLRDSVGILGDFFLYPVSYIRPWQAWLAVRGTQEVNETSLRIGEYESVKNAAIAPYEAFRNAYVQYRKKEIKE